MSIEEQHKEMNAEDKTNWITYLEHKSNERYYTKEKDILDVIPNKCLEDWKIFVKDFIGNKPRPLHISGESAVESIHLKYFLSLVKTRLELGFYEK